MVYISLFSLLHSSMIALSHISGDVPSKYGFFDSTNEMRSNADFLNVDQLLVFNGVSRSRTFAGNRLKCFINTLNAYENNIENMLS